MQSTAARRPNCTHSMKQADAVAAIGVAGIIIFVSYQLGKRTIEGPLDTAPKGVDEKIKSLVSGMPGIIDCHRVRVRNSGPETFIDAHIMVDPSQPFFQVHNLTDEIQSYWFFGNCREGVFLSLPVL